MQKIIALPSGDILDCFTPGPDFKSSIPYLPDDILTAGRWVADTCFYFTYRDLVPAMLFFCEGKLLAVKEKEQYRIWFGDRITQNDILQYPDMHSLAARTLLKERVPQKTPYNFIGYATWKQGRIHNEFLVVYAATLHKKRLLKNELWLTMQQIYSVYYLLEPLSRKLFDVFYENPILYKKYLFVSQKTDKTVDTASV